MRTRIDKRKQMTSAAIAEALQLPERNRAERKRKGAILVRAARSGYLRKHGWGEPTQLAPATTELIT
jgi:hypothetical protein